MADERAVILFDGVCNLCNAAVNFVIERDPEARFRFAPLQSDAGRELLARSDSKTAAPDSVVLIVGDRACVKSSAALRIAAHLAAPWPLLSAFRIVPRPMRDFVYDWIARNRYRWFGRRDACMLPTPALEERFLA